MKKQFILWLAITIIVLFLLPWMMVQFVPSDAGMMACILLLLAVNPIYSIFTGTIAGKNIKSLWSLPAVAAILFLLGAWLSMDFGEMDFFVYAAIYLVLGIVSMLVCNIRKRI